MARPIEATPVLRGADARILLQDMDKIRLSPEKEKELSKCVRLYRKFYKRVG